MTIAEVAKKYDITPDTLRYYEKEGLLPNVKRTKSGIRDYTEEDCNWVNFIKCMRSAGLSIEVLKEYITLFWQGDDTVSQRKDILVQQREILKQKLEAMKETIQRLDYKIEKYDEIIVDKEKKLKNK